MQQTTLEAARNMSADSGTKQKRIKSNRSCKLIVTSWKNSEGLPRLRIRCNRISKNLYMLIWQDFHRFSELLKIQQLRKSYLDHKRYIRMDIRQPTDRIFFWVTARVRKFVIAPSRNLRSSKKPINEVCSIHRTHCSKNSISTNKEPTH